MQWHGINQNQKFYRKVHDCDDQDLPQLLTVHPREQQHPAGKAYKKINLVVCKVDSMAEEKCDKCSFVGDKAAMTIFNIATGKYHATLASICAGKTVANS